MTANKYSVLGDMTVVIQFLISRPLPALPVRLKLYDPLTFFFLSAIMLLTSSKFQPMRMGYFSYVVGCSLLLTLFISVLMKSVTQYFYKYNDVTSLEMANSFVN